MPCILSLVLECECTLQVLGLKWLLVKKGPRKKARLSKPNENAFPPPGCPLKSYCVRIWFPKLPLICELAGF